MSIAPIIESIGLSHHFGTGELRKQILFEVNVSVQAGEIVIMTGPSGSGKTTLLTLLGGLRAVQDGDLRVLGSQLRHARPRELEALRRQIGFIFQAHNLLPALTAQENVEMALAHQPGWTAKAARARAAEMLSAVGLDQRMHHLPRALSGGQRQRVAIARALAANPRLILADEPTAALDKKSGREVVELLRTLAKQQGIPILIVTHDSRILDVADRLVSLEEGRLSTFANSFMLNTQNTVNSLMQAGDKQELMRQVGVLPAHDFADLLQRLSDQLTGLVNAMEMLKHDNLENFLCNLLEVVGAKISLLLGADRGSLFLVDKGRGELWSLTTVGVEGAPLEIRFPMGKGIAGRVAETGRSMHVPDAYAEPLFNREVDSRTGYRTRNILCLPLRNRAGDVFAVVQMINKFNGAAFNADDEKRFGELSAGLTALLEAWQIVRQRSCQ
jgi:putative ABC transport system ATP-binding protein